MATSNSNSWVAAEELNSSYHNGDTYQIIGFLNHGDLTQVPEQ